MFCDRIAKIQKRQNLGITDILQRHPLVGNVMRKHISVATDMPTTEKVLVSSVFPQLSATVH
jgi:hypothetical protein